MTFFVDIETAETRDPALIKQLQAAVKPPGQYKKADSIAKWWADEGEAAKLAAVAETALNGTYGRLVSFAWAFEDGPVQCVAGDDEGAVLDAALPVLRDAGRFASERWVAFNGDFDFRFIRQRCAISSRSQPPLPIKRGDYFYDVMREWAGYRSFIKQLDLERALGIPRAQDITGADVGAYVAMGDFETVREHNMNDVFNLREIYRRMTL